MEKIAILIIAHKSPFQLQKLVQSLTDERFVIFIHLDAKSNINEFESLVSNCIFIQNRHKTYLYSNTLIKAALSLINSASSNGKYKYFILISGQDYPIKSNDVIYNTLTRAYPTSFLESTPVMPETWCQSWGRLNFNQYYRHKLHDVLGNKWYNSRLGKLFRIPIKIIDLASTPLTGGSPILKLKKLGFKMAAGSAFWMLPDTAVKIIKSKIEQCPEIIDIFDHIQAPEECFFQTILSDTLLASDYPEWIDRSLDTDPLVSRMDREILRFIYDYRDGKSSGHPYNIREVELDIVLNSQSLFARKFDSHQNPNVLKRIEEFRNNVTRNS